MLVITIDSTVIGLREREVRDGMEQLLRGGSCRRFGSPHRFLLVRAGWWSFARWRPSRHAQYRHRKEVSSRFVMPTAPSSNGVFLERYVLIRTLWKGPIVIKGVLTGDAGSRSTMAQLPLLFPTTVADSSRPRVCAPCRKLSRL